MLRAWIKRLNKHWLTVTTQKRSPAHRAVQRRRAPLGVELLEDRVTPSQFALLSPSLPSLTAGQTCHAVFSATGGDGHYSYSLASGTLPTGLSLSSAGLLSGRPTAAGSFKFAVTATDTTLSGFSATNPVALTVNPAAVSTFAITAPGAATAGTSFNVTITAKDAFGNTATGFSGGVTLISRDGQTVYVAAPPRLANGAGTAVVTLDKANTVILGAAWSSIRSNGVSITVNPAAAATFVVSTPGSATAGAGFQVNVTARDVFGNTATGFSGNVTLTSSDAQTVNLLSTSSANGTTVATVALNTVGKVTLTAASGTVHGASRVITVSPAAAATLVVTAPGSATVGTRFNVTITAKDAFGNTATGTNALATLTCSDGEPVQTAVRISGGTALAAVTLNTAGTVTLTASAGTINGASGNITVSPLAATKLTVSAPATVTIGTGFNVTITATDTFGNTATSCNGAATLTSSDGQTVNVSAPPTLANGTVTVTVTLNTRNKLTLTAAVGSLRGASGNITVGPTDWFSENMNDCGLQSLARTDFNQHGSLTYGDVLGLFAAAESAGPLTSAELQSLQVLVTPGGVAAVKMASSVQSLTSKVVNGDPANAHYQGATLGNLHVGSSATQLQKLAAKWFLGEDRPVIDMEFLSGSVNYASASGTLFASGGPTYKDVYQGEEGDCWLLASFGETAAIDTAIIQGMFTDDGTTPENGVSVHVWTVRFFDYNGVATYVTVDNYLPAKNGAFMFANFGQSVTNSSNVLWVALVEKAYAQLCESGWNQRPQSNAYAALCGGWAATALPVITGHQENNTSPYGSASAFSSAISSGRLLTLGSNADNNSLGIVGDHDYAVLGYNASNQTFTLLNPWGWNNPYARGFCTSLLPSSSRTSVWTATAIRSLPPPWSRRASGFNPEARRPGSGPRQVLSRLPRTGNSRRSSPLSSPAIRDHPRSVQVTGRTRPGWITSLPSPVWTPASFWLKLSYPAWPSYSTESRGQALRVPPSPVVSQTECTCHYLA